MILDAIGKQKINFYFVILTGVLNIVFNYFFILEYGVIGAAYGTLVTYIIGFALNQWYIKRFMDVSLLRIPKYMIFFYKKVWDMGLSKLKC